MKNPIALGRFLFTDPGDVGCEEAMELPHVYLDQVARDIAAAKRYQASPPHLGPRPVSGRLRRGILAAVVGSDS